MNKRKLKIFFIGFAIVTAVLRYFLINQAHIVEHYYSNGFFPLVRSVFDHTIFYSFVPMIFVFLFISIAYLVFIVIRLFKQKTEFKKRLGAFIFSLSTFLSVLYFSFMWLWGFNYLRQPIEHTLQFTPSPIPSIALKNKLVERIPNLLEARNAIPDITQSAIDDSFLPDHFEEKIRSSVMETLSEYDLPARTKVQGRFLPKGTLLRIKTAGVYFPFVGESNIDAGLHPLQYSETLAHEFAHAYGFGDEGTCSFIAYLSLLDSEDPFIRYSLLLDYWRTLARNYLQYDNKDYQEFRKTLPSEIIADLDAIAENRLKYPSLFPNARNKIYDSYLKAQGIKEGMKNYNRVIMLVEGYGK